MNAILIDDEIKAAETLELMLNKYCPQVNIKATANGLSDLLQLDIRSQIDVIFLDINFGEYSGFDILEQIDIQGAEIIFVTAFDNHAIQAIKHNAFDYLVKPIDPEELMETVKKLAKKRNKLMSKEVATKTILIPDKNAYLKVSVDDILCFAAHGSYTKVITSLKTIVSSKPLKFFEDNLTDHRFFRVHASYIVNLDQVEKVSMGRDQPLVLMNGTEIPVSRSKRKELMELMKL